MTDVSHSKSNRVSLTHVKHHPIILVTGASGFVGSALVRRLSNSAEYKVRATLRQNSLIHLGNVEFISNCELTSGQKIWAEALTEVDTVIHTAARVHVMKESNNSPLIEFRRINVEGTLNLARQAARSGVRRFVFISSIKVNGEISHLDRPFTAFDKPCPLDAYGISKMEAEDGLRSLAVNTKMEIVIIRPPLVYGPGVKANFLNMIKWLRRDIPLPLGGIRNKRSFVALDNLIDLIVTCIQHPDAGNRTFLVSDGVDLSTTELLNYTATVMGKSARLICVPQTLFKIVTRLLGDESITQRLFGSLQVDIEYTRNTLNWTPPVSVSEALSQTVNMLLRNKGPL